MVIEINLLPPKHRQPRWPINKIMVLLAIASVVVIMSLAGFQRYTIWQLEKDIAAAQQQYSLLSLTQKMMVQADSQNQVVAAKTTLLLKLTTERKAWHAIFGRLGVIAPPQIWLTELTVADKGVLRIRGNAVAYPDLVKFLQLLEQDELLTAPQLVKAEQDAVATVTRFELTVKVKGMQP